MVWFGMPLLANRVAVVLPYRQRQRARCLQRLTGTGEDGMPPILRDHPLTPDRKAMLEADDTPATGPALLAAAEWQALKRVCSR